MNDTQFENRLDALEQRVGLLPYARARGTGRLSQATLPSLSERLGVVLVLAPLGMIGGMLTHILLDPDLPMTMLSFLLAVLVALGHVLLLGALAVAAAKWVRYPMLVYGLAGALLGYGLAGLENVVL